MDITCLPLSATNKIMLIALFYRILPIDLPLNLCNSLKQVTLFILPHNILLKTQLILFAGNPILQQIAAKSRQFNRIASRRGRQRTFEACRRCTRTRGERRRMAGILLEPTRRIMVGTMVECCQ
uniref:Uncharacterized protein n=1 Tax=Opuntia streptacantha TaxID=393608 RepID=A0A7C9ATY3_OPUST